MFETSFHTLRLIRRYQSIQSIHRFIYYLRKLPLVGKHIPSSLHNLSQVHVLVSLFGLFSGILKNVLSKVYYFAVFFSPIFFFLKDRPNISVLSAITCIFLGLNVIGQGPYKAITGTNADRLDYELLLLFKFPVNAYYHSKIANAFISTIPSFLLIGLIVFLFKGLNIAVLFILLTVYALNKITHEAIGAYIHKNTKLFTGKYSRYIYVIVLTLLMLAIAYVPLTLPIINQDFSLAFYLILLLISLILAIVSFLYLRTFDFNHIKNGQLDIANYLSNSASIEKKDTLLKAYTIKDSQYTEEIPAKLVDGKNGLAYAHAIFFARFKKIFFRPILIIFLITVGAGLLLIILSLLLREEIAFEGTTPIALVPAVIMYTYFVGSFGQSYTAKIFANMDKNLLLYNFYRKPALIFEGLKIRSLHLLKLNLPSMLVVSIYIIILGRINFPDYPFEVFLLLLVYIFEMIFFNFYSLILYYAFQPYDQSMQIKSLPVQISNIVVSLVSVALFNIHDVSINVYFVIMAVQAVALIVFTSLLTKLAPKNFRLKNS